MINTLREAVEYGFQTRAAGIMEKDGKYNVAKDWDEITYAEEHGWTYVGHPVDLKKKLAK